jgi:hypothetical protein
MHTVSSVVASYTPLFLTELSYLQKRLNYGDTLAKEDLDRIASVYGVGQQELFSLLALPHLFHYPHVERLARVSFAMQRRKLSYKFFSSTPHFSWVETQLKKGDFPFLPLLDLGAFPDPQEGARCVFASLQELGIREIVLMEDRHPVFFFHYQHFDPKLSVPLNRHGPFSHQWTQGDLFHLMEVARSFGISVFLGFWLHNDRLPGSAHGFLASYGGENFFSENSFALSSLWPRGGDMHPFTQVNTHLGKYTLVDYIGIRYRALVRDFGFSGLFIGDGGMGMRNFFHLDDVIDFSPYISAWTDFYRRLGEVVHDTGGTVLAYDCNGYGKEEVLRHGVDYAQLLGANTSGKPYLDRLILQYYPEAWSRYMRVPDRTNDQQNRQRITSVLEWTKGLPGQCVLSYELGDAVEGWSVSLMQGKRQMEYYAQLSEKYTSLGLLGVWSNAFVRYLLEGKK